MEFCQNFANVTINLKFGQNKASEKSASWDLGQSFYLSWECESLEVGMCPLAILSALHHKHTHTYSPLWVGNYSDLFDQSTGSLAFCPTVKTAVCERETREPQL